MYSPSQNLTHFERDYFNVVWRLSYRLNSNTGKIERYHAENDEVMASYDLMAYDRDGDLQPLSIVPLRVIAIGDLLILIALEDDSHVLLTINPQWTVPENGYLIVLNKIDVPQVFDDGFTIGLDLNDPMSFAVRNGNGTDDIKIKLWYDYYTFDNDQQIVLFRENYEGGLDIR